MGQRDGWGGERPDRETGEAEKQVRWRGGRDEDDGQGGERPVLTQKHIAAWPATLCLSFSALSGYRGRLQGGPASSPSVRVQPGH